MSVVILRGDAACLPLPGESVDAVVCDPPYALEFMGRKWDTFEPAAFQSWCEAWARECLRVLKPGGHLLAFGAPRTYHRLACGIEDAGFEVRDSLHWIYGSGFPKGQDIAKKIDRRRDDRDQVLQVTAWLAQARDAAGWTNRRLNDAFGYLGDRCSHWTTQGVAASVPAPEHWDKLRELLGFDDAEILPLVDELNGRKGSVGEDWRRREVVGQAHRVRRPSDVQFAAISEGAYDVTAPAAEAAREWEGWNTALKPAHEPVILARKSTGFHSTVANVLMHGTGALNIDGCRVGEGGYDAGPGARAAGDRRRDEYRTGTSAGPHVLAGAGRWPSNVLLSEEAAAELDRQSGVLTSGANPARRPADKSRDAYGEFTGQQECTVHRGADSGGASRFFPVFRYEAKAGAAERPRLPDGTAWPTVKPVALMQWLVRLVTPPGGTVLDPFCGTGTTGQACAIEGFNAILVDRDPQAIALARVRLAKPVQPTLFGEAS